jgi:hypothetical protein
MKRPPIIGSQTLKKYRGPRDIKAPSVIAEIPDMILFFKLSPPIFHGEPPQLRGNTPADVLALYGHTSPIKNKNLGYGRSPL